MGDGNRSVDSLDPDRPPSFGMLMKLMTQMHSNQSKAQKRRNDDIRQSDIVAGETAKEQNEDIKHRDEDGCQRNQDAHELANVQLHCMDQLINLATSKKSTTTDCGKFWFAFLWLFSPISHFCVIPFCSPIQRRDPQLDQ